MSNKLQIIVDDQLNLLIHQEAKRMGLSLSSFMRYALKEFLTNKKRQSLLKQALSDEVEETTLARFKQELKELKGA